MDRWRDGGDPYTPADEIVNIGMSRAQWQRVINCLLREYMKAPVSELNNHPNNLIAAHIHTELTYGPVPTY